MKIRVVVFDLFGTLIRMRNTVSPYRRIFELAQERGHMFAEIRRKVLTRNMPEPSDIADLFGLKGFDNEEFISRIEAELRSVSLFPEVSDILRWLKAEGFKTTLISNLASPYKQAFYNLDLDKFIDSPIFSCDFGCMKPERQIYEVARVSMGVEFDEMAMVGDSRACDVDGPQAVGMHGFHLLRTVERGPSESMRSLRELPERILRS